MQLHVIKRNLENLWRRKTVRAAAVVLVVVVTIYLQYRLVNRPEPLDLASSKVTIPEIYAAQKLHIEAQAAGPDLVIAHGGKLSEEIDVHFNKARLGPTTISDYEEERPPTQATEIHCSPTNWIAQKSETPQPPVATNNSSKPKPCSTSVIMTPGVPKQGIVELNFFQSDTNGRDRYRHLITEVSNVETVVKLKLVPRLSMPSADSTATNSDDSAIDCGRYLTVGNWQQRIGGAAEIETIMDPASTLRIRFTQLESGLWSGTDGFFQPFSLTSTQQGNPTSSTPLRARSVSIQTADGKQTTFSATSADESLIKVDNLKVGSDRLQVALNGSAYVTLNGEEMSESVLERVQKYPFVGGVLAALNLAILTWCAKVVKGLLT